MRAISMIAYGNWRTRSQRTVQILMGIGPAEASPECRPAGGGAYRTWDLRLLSPAPDTAEDSNPTAELPLLPRPVAALRPRISAAERSRSPYFRCKEQQKQRGA